MYDNQSDGYLSFTSLVYCTICTKMYIPDEFLVLQSLSQIKSASHLHDCTIQKHVLDNHKMLFISKPNKLNV